MQDATLVQLVEDRTNQQVAIRVVGGDWHQPTGHFPEVMAAEGHQREALLQQQGMLAASLGTFRVGTEGVRIGAHLIGHEPEQWQRRVLADTQ